jgi:methanogenic corrinoid protein MtbC1
MPQSKELYEAILNGDAKKAFVATQVQLESGHDPMQLIAESMVPA